MNRRWTKIARGGHPVIEREHTRVHEENETEAGKVRWVWLVRLDDVSGQAGRCEWSGWMKMGTDGRRWG